MNAQNFWRNAHTLRINRPLAGGTLRTEYRHYLGQPDAWAVVSTHPNKEHIALENIRRQDFRAYCPMVRRSRSHARRVTDVLAPLFRSYLFVQISQETQRWRPLLSTYGVRTLVRCGDQLSFLEDGFIQSLKVREMDGVIVRPASPYQVGQQVRMAGGAFDGVVATILSLDEKDRLVVLMDLLSRPVKVKVEAAHVSPA